MSGWSTPGSATRSTRRSLIEGVYDQGPFTYRLRPSEAEPGGVAARPDARGSFVGMDFRRVPTEMTAFESEHVRLSTSPESGFVRVLAIQRRDATGVDVVKGLVLTRLGNDSTSTTLDREADYFACPGRRLRPPPDGRGEGDPVAEAGRKPREVARDQARL